MSDVLYRVDGPIATVTIDRAERKNTLTPAGFVQLGEAWREIERDDAVRVAILTASGSEMFSAGGDLGAMIPLLTGARVAETDAERAFLADPGVIDAALLKPGDGAQPLTGKPIVAAINGAALGGGFELMQATDLRVAVSHARFALPEVQRAIVPGGGSMVRLPRQLPWAIAMEVLMTGEPISAAQALQWGLINRIVEADELMSAARALAERIAANGPLAVRAVKDCALRSSGLPLEQGFAIERELAARVMASEDAREGPLAFKQKRTPVYRGR